MGTKQLVVFGAALIAIMALIVVFRGTSLTNPLTRGEPVACTDDAKICPDGSAVGRTGPNCEFAACPDTAAPGTKVSVAARLNQPAEVLGETIIVKKVLEDSRCPIDVQCIWAGTVRLDVTIRGGMGDGQLTLELGKTGTSEVNSFTLMDVQPTPMSTTSIEESDYVFTFEVTRRD